MNTGKITQKFLYRTVHDYFIITVAMLLGILGLQLFLLPHQITMGGTIGIATVIYWGTGIPLQDIYFAINATLLLMALKVLGWRFCVKTIFAVIIFTFATSLLEPILSNIHLLTDQKFMALIVGAVFMGTSVGLGLSVRGSTGGSDLVAAMVHKYRDMSLGHIILFCDLAVITSSYLVLRDWNKVLYSYVLLFVISFVVDHIVNTFHQSVQFFIISDKFEQIGEAINTLIPRGCSTLNGNGFYSKKDIRVIYCIAKKNESSLIFELIEEIDPDAFVAQSSVIGVYGQGFDRIKRSRRAKALYKEKSRQLEA